MIFGSTHTRFTRTSSDLRTLSATLVPPSPVLKAHDFLTSSTSGEIPILLETTTDVCDPIPPGELRGLHDVAKELKPIGELGTTIGNTRHLTRSNEASLFENRICKGSEDVCGSLELQNTCHAELRSTIHSAYHNVPRRSSILDNCSTGIIIKQSKFEELRDPRASYPSAMEFSTAAVAAKELDDDQLLMLATFHTYSTLPTPTFAPPSASSSADVISPASSPSTRQRHRRPLERARAVRFPGRPKSPRLQVHEIESNFVHNIPPSPTKHGSSHSRWQLTDSASPVSTYSCVADPRVSDAAQPSMKHVTLPEELSWLNRMTVELWIDQEGFRAVRSCMQLMGYSTRTRSLHPYEFAENAGTGVTAGVAEFMPTRRETFTFHYATLDSPPTLRMVSVADDESRDYISKQATLSIKANGVYTVLGMETSMASMPNSDAHGMRLYWKFDYLVSDRKVDGTGKTLPGEKTLTPLTFSCSPYLLHPLQGKKTGLMHVMKKNLVPKLGSQKLEPPPYAQNHSILPQTLRHLSTPASHIRSRSHAYAKNDHSLTGPPPLDTAGKGGTIFGMNHVQRTRRRRASSAAEDSFACLKVEPRGGIVAGMFTPGATVFRGGWIG